MNMWAAIVLIVAVVMIADSWVKVARARAAKRVDDKDAEEMLGRINSLEERIRVLERIVTEDKDALRKEIGRL